MKLLLTSGKLQKFSEIMVNCKHLCEFITLTFSEDGIYSQGLTMDHCAMYELKIKEDWFDDYEWEKDVDAKNVSVSSEYLSKIIQTRQPSQYLVIEYHGNPDSIIIKFASTISHGRNQEFPKEFCLPLIDVDNEVLTIPKMEYSAEFGIDSKALNITNDQLSLFDENLTVHCSEDEIYLRSSGTHGELKVILFNENCEHITEFSLEEDLSLTLDFSIKHFNTFCKFIKISSCVMLSFTKDVPMKFEYNMNEDVENEEDKDQIYIAFYLAPKIVD